MQAIIGTLLFAIPAMYFVWKWERQDWKDRKL
jgi:hypothetical protein